MILTDQGVPLMCETEGCANGATGTWSTMWAGGRSGQPHYACDRHNPMNNAAMALPQGFTSQPLCHACRQPIQVSSLISRG